MKGKGRASGFKKVLLRFFFFFLNCADVENCGSFKSFDFICIYRLIGKVEGKFN